MFIVNPTYFDEPSSDISDLRNSPIKASNRERNGLTSTQLSAVETVTALLIEELKKSSHLTRDKKLRSPNNSINESIEGACSRAALRLIQTAIELSDSNLEFNADQNPKLKFSINPLSIFGNNEVIEKLVGKTQVKHSLNANKPTNRL